MIFQQTELEGLLVVRPTRNADQRGLFARLWCADTFASAGLRFQPRQISVSHNTVAGTLRGLHWQAAPHAETKLVRASRGRVFDVAVDLRENSPTFQSWYGIELDAESYTALFIPPGFAHGFITLTDGAELTYCIDVPYAPAAARGARFDDPALAIKWPYHPGLISERDLAWPPLRPGSQLLRRHRTGALHPNQSDCLQAILSRNRPCGKRPQTTRHRPSA